jgi:hypothetical protein
MWPLWDCSERGTVEEAKRTNTTVRTRMRSAGDETNPQCPVCGQPLMEGTVRREQSGGTVMEYRALICLDPKCSYDLPPPPQCRR